MQVIEMLLQKNVAIYNLRRQSQTRCFIFQPLQTHMSIIHMLKALPKPDTISLKQIVKKNKLSCLNITDFRIINGERMYKIEWVQFADNQQKFKWQTLRNLQPFIDDIIKYEQQNKLKITKIENEWSQYFYDGQVNKPLQYFGLKKILQESQDISNNGDSQYYVGRKGKNKVCKKQKSILKSNKKKRKAKKQTHRTQKNKIAKKKLNQRQTVELNKQNKTTEATYKKVERKMSLQAQLQKYLLDWTLQVPYVELDYDGPNQISQINKVNQISPQTLKKDIDYLPSTLHQNQSKSNQLQKEENEEESHQYSYKLFTSEQNDDSNFSQSYQEVEQEQCQYERPQNMRQFIKQQMIALNIESPSELLNSTPKLKIQETFSQKSQFQSYSRKQQLPDHFQVNNNKIKKECQIGVKQEDKIFQLAQLFQKIDLISKSERTKIRKDNNYKYIYDNILSADVFCCYPRPHITTINTIICYSSLKFYSVNVMTQKSLTQKFVLPELMTKYYPQIQERFFYDC